MLPSLETLAPVELATWIRRQGLSHVYLPTPLAEALLRSGEAAGLVDLDLLSTGGDRLQRAADESLPFRFLNLYGPTEACVNAVAGPVGRDGSPRPSIGRPLRNTGARVLDGAGRPVPVGVAGELWIGGAGVARGYLGQAALTASRFVPDPLAGSGAPAGARAYRTGDLVRWLPDGRLDFLGRIDHQVQLRGLRIELGEIEAVLAREPRVREAVVVADGPVGRIERLIAYVVPAETDGTLEPSLLAAALRRSLPEYMVPAAWVVLEALPLTPNGKVDRRALPPVRAEGETGERVAPRDEAEGAVAAVFAELLEVPEVGAFDDFFALGGHSLLATRVVSRLGRTFGVEVPLRALFEAPTVAALAVRLVEQRRSEAGTALPPVEPVARDVDLPLSFAQQRLWIIDRLQPGTPFYNIPMALRVSGPLSPPLLSAVLGEVVRRHEVLRTVYRDVEGEPFQRVLPYDGLAVPAVDLSALPEVRRETELRRLTAAEAARPFDLSAGPVLRTTLLRTAAREHAVLLTVHHIASDGWSTGVLVREVSALYAAFAAGQPSPLPELAVQYGDFAAWQRRWLEGEVLERQVEHWRGRLAGLPPLLDLPTDRPRPATQTARGGEVAFALPADLVAGLTQLGRRHGATLFMVLLAAFDVLLSRLSGRRDVVVGTPVAGRTRPEIEGLVGFFVNTLVLRTDLEGGPSFAELVERVRETALEAHDHQELPFERLVEELDVERSLAHEPLFQVMFALQNVPQGELEAGELELRPLEGGGAPTARYDLFMALAETAGRLDATLVYAADLFDATTARRWVEQWRRILAAAVAKPDLPLAELALVSPAERHQLTREWNDTAVERVGPSAVERVLAQGAKLPDAVAVVAGELHLSYGALVARAWGLAAELAALGVGAESVVGVQTRRSPALLIAQIAVWLAGGAYLPLDPAHPPVRRRDVLAEAAASALISEPDLAAELDAVAANGAGARSLPPVVDPMASVAAPGARRRAVVRPSPANLAYVLFTSGSTGRPKGVAMSHGALANLLDWSAGLDFGPATRTSQVAGPAFDASVWEIWAALTTGGSLHLLPSLETLAPVELATWIRRQGLSHVYLPTPLAEAFLRSGEAAGLVELDLLSTGGDRLQRAADESLPFRFLNLYGPTEACVNAVVGSVEQDGSPRPSIGRPVRNTGARVLDGAGRPVPVGVAGELWIGGAGVGRGYLGRPALTAARFVPDPLAGAGAPAGARAYRTGDLVRWLPDGRLDFLGRIDHQVQLRGLRIELGEIEAVLAREPRVREAVVVADGPVGQIERLIAYVVPAGTVGTLEPSMLADALRRSLPEYMVPAAWVVLESLPLTPNGKVDRRALPRVQAEATQAALLPPRDALEMELVRLWKEVLEVEELGVRDDFFAVGGHSLAAVRLASRIRLRLGTELPLAVFFQAPTVERLAVHLRRRGAGGDRSALVPIGSAEGGPSLPPLFCVHPVGGEILCYAELARALPGSWPIYGLQTPQEPDSTLEGMARRYLGEVRQVQHEGPYRLAGWSLGGVVAFEMARQLHAEGQPVELLALIDPPPPQEPDEEGSEPNLGELAGLYIRDLWSIRGRGDDLDLGLVELPPEVDLEALEELFGQAREAGLLPPDLELEEARRSFDRFVHNLLALRRYAPQPYAGPLLVLSAGEGPRGGEAPSRGWDRLAAAVEAHVLPADHYGLLRHPVVHTLARHLERAATDPITETDTQLNGEPDE